MKKSRFIKIVIAIFFSLILPVISVTVFEIIQQDKNETLLESIYQRQLDTILFAVNQTCWDNFNSWVTELSAQFAHKQTPLTTGGSTASALEKYTRTYPSILGVFIRTDIQKYAVYMQGNSAAAPGAIFGKKATFEIEKLIIEKRQAVLTMASRARQGYVNPLVLHWKRTNNKQITLLLFPLINIQNAHTMPTLAGIFIDNLTYIDEVVGRKFNSMHESSFIFAVRDTLSGELVYATEHPGSAFFERSEALWILPSLQLEIKLTGTTLEEFIQARAQTNVIFLIIVNIILIVGIFYIVRYIYLEMRLAQKEKDFVANVSHELRTPLALIRMFAELMEMGRVRSDEKKQHYYKTIMAESTRLTQLINNILDFSKIESRRKTYELNPGNLRALVIGILDFYQYHIQQKGFVVGTDLDLNLPQIIFDEVAIRQAVVNLIDNAIKYSHGGKRINISLKRKNGTLVLAIQDFGVGIAPGEQTKVFNKFYRTENSLVHNTRGSGLGLALVKNIMLQHGGQVTVNSKVGEGSTFSLIFPISRKNGARHGKNTDN